MKSAVQSEPPTVVSASHRLQVGFALHHKRAPMCADVGKAVCRPVVVACEHQGLVQASLEEGDREETWPGALR